MEQKQNHSCNHLKLIFWYRARERVKYRFSLTKRDTTTGIEKIHEFTRRLILYKIYLRYSHFEWLQIELQTKLLGRIIPSLP